MRSHGITVGRSFAVALVILFLARAVTGWIGGSADSQGRRLAAAGHLESAIPLLERGALGQNRAATRWLAGEARLGLYQTALFDDAPPGRLEELLHDAFRDHTAAISLCPASGWYWASLADVYHQQERRQLFRHGLPLAMVGQQRWAFVGQPGRVAIGLLRMAIEREPTQYLFYDQLAFALLAYGLPEAAVEVVRESARVQPAFGQHEYGRLTPIPEIVLDAFAEASREALGQVPLMRQFGHLLSLGKLELRRGNSRQAEQDLREALALPGTRLNYADANFRLGVALKQQVRHDEAIEAFLLAEIEPIFEPLGLASRAAIAEDREDLEQALSLMRRARRLQPMQMSYAMEYARMAVEFERPDWAEEALAWAVTLSRFDTRPLRALEDVLLDQGKRAEATEVRRQIGRIEDGPPVDPDTGS